MLVTVFVLALQGVRALVEPVVRQPVWQPRARAGIAAVREDPLQLSVASYQLYRDILQGAKWNQSAQHDHLPCVGPKVKGLMHKAGAMITSTLCDGIMFRCGIMHPGASKSGLCCAII